MKELLQKILLKIKSLKLRTIAVYIGISAVVIVSGAYYFVKGDNTKAETTASMSETINPEDSIMSVVGSNGELTDKSAISNSWPAEIISNDISQIQPQREGVIANWQIHIGEQVKAGQVLGKISAPPATPELIQMLAEKQEALAMARAQIGVTDDYAKKEQQRLDSLKVALNNSSSTSQNIPIAAEFERLRNNVEVKGNALKAFIERTLNTHVTMLTNYSNWKYVRYGGLDTGMYGTMNQGVQSAYETALVSLINKMKNGGDLPIEDAQNYFNLAVQLANNTPSDPDGFKAMANTDQKEFFEMLAEYKMAQSEVTDKEADYKVMLNEQSSMLEKDKSMLNEKIAMLEKDKAMARSNAVAIEASYATVYNEIKGETYIKAPRSGIVSAIYKKVGDLVGPEMAIATITGGKKASLIARIRIPNNIIKPKTGDTLQAIRPGFPKDIHEVKIVGIGSSLDYTGAYMADAVFTDNIDWPVEASIRIIPPATSNTPVIKMSSIVWGDGGDPFVWAVSSGGRIYAKHVKIGRILGESVEIYEGLKDGDKYITSPTSDIKENILLDEIIKAQAPQNSGGSSGKSNGKGSMPGMDM